jgi:hypothetical protein
MSPWSSSRYPQRGTLITTPDRLILARQETRYGHRSDCVMICGFAGSGGGCSAVW